MLLRLLSRLNDAAARRPAATAVGIGGAKNLTCDGLVQAATSDGFDARRAALFTTFGLVWVGGVQFALFNRLFPALLPGLAHQSRSVCAPGASRIIARLCALGRRSTLRAQAVAAAVAVDNCVHIPLFYLPAFYSMREFSIPSERELSPSEVIGRGLRSWQQNLRGDLSVQACIFVPVQVLNFGLNPPHLRVPTTVAAGAVWVSALSFLRGGGRGVELTHC